VSVTPEFDGKSVIVGGIISTIRTIVTKNGSRMAFVGIEDKTGEAEVIVFPGLFEKNNGQLIQDAVMRVTGKINAHDRDGNLGSDAKIMADEIEFITDQQLSEYQSTGAKMKKPKHSKVEAKRVPEIIPELTQVDLSKKLYVHIKDPDDHDTLLSLKKVCSEYPGVHEIVLVLGADKKSAIKLPFQVDPTDILISKLVKILGEDCVKFK